MNEYQRMNPEAFTAEYEEEQRVLREIAEENYRVRVLGLALDVAIAKVEAEMHERGEDFEPEYFEDDCPMDGDAESALASCGWGTDEDYEHYDEWEQDGWI